MFLIRQKMEPSPFGKGAGYNYLNQMNVSDPSKNGTVPFLQINFFEPVKWFRHHSIEITYTSLNQSAM